VLVDWFTVVAQIVNFLILVALLRHFLYGRILKTIDEREADIAARREEAEKEKDEAEKEAESYREKNEQWGRDREEKLSRVKEEVAERKKELLEEARKEVDAEREKWHEALKQDRTSFSRDLRTMAGRQVHETARRVLSDLAHADLEQNIIESFLEQLSNLEEQERRRIKDSMGSSEGGLTVESSFEIPEERKKWISEVLQDLFSGDGRARFEISEDLICGIRIRTDDYQVGWNVASYLRGLEERLDEVIQEEALESGRAESHQQEEDAKEASSRKP
jgi:F-type H+-transporting ATPase subunit b